jgi:hypothetical protein
LVHPSGHGDQHEPEWVEGSRRLQSPLSLAMPETAPFQQDRVFGHYAILLSATTHRGFGGCDGGEFHQNQYYWSCSRSIQSCLGGAWTVRSTRRCPVAFNISPPRFI